MNSTKSRRKVLFLYSEPAEYFLACLRELQKSAELEIHVVHFKVNPEAPFKFNFPEGITFYLRDNYSYSELLLLTQKISPSLIYCSGWLDKSYLRVCRTFKNKIPILLALDNPWKGNIRQIAALPVGIVLASVFSHAWVPGKRQIDFAKKLGFSDHKILRGVYSADVPLYTSFFEKFISQKKINFPKRFLYVGRFTESKGTTDLWKAFIEFQEESPSEWELWCAGTGDLNDKFPLHPKIKNLGFVQPDSIEKVIRETGVFVLPSRYEPWGVALHELAAAGFPLIVSDEVGAAERFLVEGKNGFRFEAKNISSLKKCFKECSQLSQNKLVEMGEKSTELASQFTPADWSKVLLKLMN